MGRKFAHYVVARDSRQLILEQLHSSVLSGHLMFDKTYEKARERFFWPFMRRDIEKFIETCDECQRATGTHRQTRAALQPMVSDRPLELVTTDCLGPLKQSRAGNTNFSVVVDHKTKFG